MPHEFVIGAFEPGDDDMGDFILDRWLPFARDDCNWVDNRAPSPGTRPDIECWTHRGTTGSPLAPFVFLRTEDRHMMIFTGNGVNLGQEIYDQPGNPANAPKDASFTIPTSGGVGNDMRCGMINSAVGPYQGYWLFCDTAGSYIHCVLKVGAREYRHFHIGKLQQVDGGPDLDSESFYVTSHFWDQLDPEGLSYPDAVIETDGEHSPYRESHMVAFRNGTGFNDTGAFGGAMPNTITPARFYMPNLSTHVYDWYFPQAGDGLEIAGSPAKKTTTGGGPLAVGDVNTTMDIGLCTTNYYDSGMGAVLFACDRNFTANSNTLVPIYVGVNFDFSGDVRLGVVAQVPDVFRVNMRDYQAEETISVGGVDYKVFPMINKDSASVVAGEGYSGWEGLAYRVETGAVV